MVVDAAELKQAAIQGLTHVTGADGLADFRAHARDTLAAVAFPDRKTEDWKYTSLKALEKDHVRVLAASTDTPALPDLGGSQVVLINGQLPDLDSLALPAGVIAQPLSSHQDKATTDMVGPFTALNGAALSDGLLLSITAGADVDGLIHIVHVASGTQAASAHPRLVIEVGSNARVTLVEHYIGSSPILTNAVTRIDAHCNSQVTHYRLQSEGSEARHIGLLEFELARDARVTSFQFMQGCALRRNDVHAVMAESGSDLRMKGVFLARGKSHIDNHVCVEHRVPNCESDQVYKGIAGEHGRAVFNGRIHIHDGASGTNAELSNKNLLLSNTAEIDTKPELEIYNDDVKCAHGTTVGQMDATQLFYLRSRGISEIDAKRMLGTGFVNELLLAIPDDAVQAWVTPWLADALTEGL
jgi:Fe-S cluster assembly protein SufD